eukprot:1585475-Amphidinium_carterae.1
MSTAFSGKRGSNRASTASAPITFKQGTKDFMARENTSDHQYRSKQKKNNKFQEHQYTPEYWKIEEKGKICGHIGGMEAHSKNIPITDALAYFPIVTQRAQHTVATEMITITISKNMKL